MEFTGSEDTFNGSEKREKTGVASSSNKLSDFGNLLKSFVGTQYMTLPYGFLQSGIVLGLVTIAAVASLTTHCCELIVKCKYYMIEDVLFRLKASERSYKDKRPAYDPEVVRREMTRRLTVVDIGYHALGRLGSVLVSLCLLVTQTGFCVGYHIFIGNVLWALLQGFAVGSNTTAQPDALSTTIHPLDTLTGSLDVRTTDNASVLSILGDDILNQTHAFTTLLPWTTPLITEGDSLYTAFHGLSAAAWLSILVVLPVPVFMVFALFRRVRGIGPISVIANVVVALCFLLILVYLSLDFSVAAGIQWFTWSTFAIMLGAAAASYEAVGTLLFIEASMEGNRHNFSLYLRVVIVVFTCMFTPLGVLGYMRYGLDTAQILLLDLPQDMLVMSVEIATIIGVMLTYPIQVFPVTELVEMFIFGRSAGDSKSAVGTSSPLLNQPDILEELGVVVTTVVPKGTATWKRNVVRISISIVIALLAVIFRNAFAYAAALVGAVGSTPLAFIFPCLFQLKMRWHVISTGIKVKNILIIVVCSVLAVCSLVVTLAEVVYLV